MPVPVAASGSRHSLWYIPETEYGTTPTNPAWIHIPHGTTTLGVSKETVEARYLSGDRQRRDVRHGNKTVSGEITFPLAYGVFDPFLEMLMGGTWTANVLKNGVIRRSMSVLRYWEDLGLYEVFTGVEANGYSITIAPNATVDMTFTLSGRDVPTGMLETPPAGSTFGTISSPSALDSFSATITEGGSVIGVVTSLTPALDNGITPLFVVGSDVTIRPGQGDALHSGSMDVYLTDKVLFNKFLNETGSSIDILFVDKLGNQLEIGQPNVKYMTATNDVTGPESLIQTLEYIALYDTTDATTVMFTRTPTP